MRDKPLGTKLKFLLVFIIFMIGIWNGYENGTQYQEEQKQEQNQNGADNGTEDADEDNVGNGTEDADKDNVGSGTEDTDKGESVSVDEDGTYTSKEDVAAYINTYEKLPSNFITKKEAQKLGWDNSKGNLAEVAPGMSIGGDHFGNYEEKLPEAEGRDYYECDINYVSGYRGSERIVYSDDGLIFYTADHYETFELLYGDEE